MRVMSYLVNAVVALSLTSATNVALAKANVAKEAISIELSAYKVLINQKGEVSVTSVTQAKPNDVIEYRAKYTNNTTKPVKGLLATLPIPADTQFLAKSSPAQAQASTDGVNFAAMPLKRKVGTQTVNIPLPEYRALRWTIAEIPAGQSVTVTAQTRVNSLAAAETK